MRIPLANDSIVAKKSPAITPAECVAQHSSIVDFQTANSYAERFWPLADDAFIPVASAEAKTEVGELHADMVLAARLSVALISNVFTMKPSSPTSNKSAYFVYACEHTQKNQRKSKTYLETEIRMQPKTKQQGESKTPTRDAFLAVFTYGWILYFALGKLFAGEQRRFQLSWPPRVIAAKDFIAERLGDILVGGQKIFETRNENKHTENLTSQNIDLCRWRE